jgi:hypothetical protein
MDKCIADWHEVEESCLAAVLWSYLRYSKCHDGCHQEEGIVS